jgi:pimeloyl-ACP methyl ester carboxylesterase
MKNTLAMGVDTPGIAAGIEGSFVDNGNGLNMHVLQAGHHEPDRPVILLLHGFPELAYSWRKVMLPLAEAGYRVIAPDQRGYGRTSGSDNRYEAELTPFQMPNLVRDELGLLAALGINTVHTVVGHDFGSPVAAYCALMRSDVFERVVLMSAPFGGAPRFGSAQVEPPTVASSIDHEALKALTPARLHYQWYYSLPNANDDMHRCEQGVHQFLRAYYHVKSADWKENQPHPLGSWDAQTMAKLPTYYMMNASENMAKTVARFMPTQAAIDACDWLPDFELAVYAEEYSRNGFQGGLQWYRCGTGAEQAAVLKLFGNKTINQPSAFISGASDWGVYQKPGDFESMQERVCKQMVMCCLLEGAGHWVQQEQHEAVVSSLIEFLNQTS